MERKEWLQLSKWVLRDWEGGIFPGPLLSSHNRWIIQVPRLWRIYRKKDGHRCFQDMLENLFVPLFEATVRPNANPEIAEFLKHIVAFDSVDDEGQSEVRNNHFFNFVKCSSLKINETVCLRLYVAM